MKQRCPTSASGQPPAGGFLPKQDAIPLAHRQPAPHSALHDAVMADIRAGSVAQRVRKYRNQPTVVDGIRFASKKEARRWTQLRLLEMAGEIRNLERQPRYVFLIDGKNIGTYVADFEYREARRSGSSEGWSFPIAEDVKGVQTEVFKLKAKLFRALYPHIELRLS